MSEIRRAIVKSYDAATHKAAVQIAGSLAVWLDAVRVATNIPPADVVAGRQCTVLFLDPSNQDDAVIIAIQGAAPSVGEILIATATSSLTLTTTAQSITGDGDSSKVRLLLPTPGDWLIEAACDFDITATDPDACIGELYLDDSGTPESARAVHWPATDLDRATVTQRWKVTTTAADTPVELKAKKDSAGGTAYARPYNTRITATGVKRSTGGAGVTDHGALTGLADDDHTQYALLAGRDGGQTLIGGTGAGDRLDLKGNSVDAEPVTRIDGKLGLNATPTIQRFAIFDSVTALTGNWTTQSLVPTITLAINVSTIWLQSIAGTVNIAGNTLTTLYGQRFAPGVIDALGGGSVTNLIAADYAPFAGPPNFTIGMFIGVRVNPVLGISPTTTAYGFYSPDWSRATITTQKVIKVEDQLQGPGTAYLEELGDSTTPNWRVEATAPSNPGADKGRSRCLATFNENGVLAVRRLEWKLQSTLVAGDKVMVAV